MICKYMRTQPAYQTVPHRAFKAAPQARSEQMAKQVSFARVRLMARSNSCAFLYVSCVSMQGRLAFMSAGYPNMCMNVRSCATVKKDVYLKLI